MIEFTQRRIETLKSLAQQQFGPDMLSQELRILEQSATPRGGSQVAVVERLPVRPEFLRWLASDQEAGKWISESGVRVKSVQVNGALNLNRCRMSVLWEFENCLFQEEVTFDRAEVTDLRFSSCIARKGLSLQGTTARGGIFLHGDGTDTGLKSDGPINLSDSRIEGDVDACGVTIDAGSGACLTLARTRVLGRVNLRNGFVTTGIVVMVDSEIDGTIDCCKGKFGALGCRNLRVGGDIKWQKIKDAKSSELYLVRSSVGGFLDDRISWPASGNLHIDGFSYNQLISADVIRTPLALVRYRLAWLNLQPVNERIEPQPFLQLAKSIAAKGDKGGQRRILFELRVNQAQRFTPLVRRTKILFAWLEEKPGRILLSIVPLIVLASCFYLKAQSQGSMAPTEGSVYKNWKDTGEFGVAYPRFNPWIYSSENSLPFLKLGQDDKWAPDPKGSSACYTFLTWLRWCLIVSGWVQGTILAAALSGRFRE